MKKKEIYKHSLTRKTNGRGVYNSLKIEFNAKYVMRYQWRLQNFGWGRDILRESASKGGPGEDPLPV